ncbi:MAG: hypothetical protein AB7V22_07455 [Kiritimatiellia bacterium]
METLTPPAPTVAKLPASKRSSYQFPVYRWIGWLTVAGYAAGLTVMFFISGMFGIPAPLGWAFLVITFVVGAMLLDRPKLLLGSMMFYFLLMPSNRLLGLLALPLPTFLDELFFLPFIAVIVMNWIQRRQLKEATLLPVAFCLVAGLSWYVNGKPALFTAIQVTLVMLKFYIVWYYCRLTCTFEDERQLSKWLWGYVIYIAIQFLYNCLWQQGPWLRFHPDASGGVFGPMGGNAHLVGYLCVFGLICIAGWWVSVGGSASRKRRWLVGLLALVIAYNLIFMTDTKHALFLFPLAFAPFLFHPRFPVRLRVWLLSAGVGFVLLSVLYFNTTAGGVRMGQTWNSIKDSPKADMFYAVTGDFSHLVRYPILGAGPGRFASNQAREARVPLARRYILPYYDEARRLGYFGRQGTTMVSSVAGSVNADFFVLMGEFGWLGAATYYLFMGWVSIRLFRKSIALSRRELVSGIYMALSCCIVFLVMLTVLTSISTVPVLVFPLWLLIGRTWDMRVDEPGSAAV